MIRKTALLAMSMLACHPRLSAPLGPGSTYGTVPAQATTVPEFSATNFDGTPRARPDLLGHPTVVWFFPAAGTPG